MCHEIDAMGMRHRRADEWNDDVRLQNKALVFILLDTSDDIQFFGIVVEHWLRVDGVVEVWSPGYSWRRSKVYVIAHAETWRPVETFV